MKQIPLTQGKFTIVDDADYASLSKFGWHFSKRYACRCPYYAPKKKLYITMHNQIMNPPEGMEVDHIDGDGLNNQRSNLRVCTHAENIRNQKLSRKNTTGVCGVVKHISGRYYAARIMFNQKQIHLGYFPTIETAKAARVAAEIKYFGDYRRKDASNIS